MMDAKHDVEIKKSICAICNPGTNCGMNLYVKGGKIIKAEGMPEHKGSGGAICSKGAAIRQYVYSPDRLKTPMKRVGEKGSGEFEEISWEEAFATISEKLNALKAKGDPESAAFFVGYTKWIRPFVQRLAYAYGSPNYCTESCTCFKATYLAWKLNYGSFPKPVIGNTKCYLVWSNNPFYSSPPGTDEIFDAKKSGVKYIVVDPRLTPFAAMADVHLRLRPGTDGALALGMANVIITEGLYDKEFTEKYMHGFEEYKEYVMTFPPEKAAELTDVPAELIIKAARLYANTKPAGLVTSSSPVVHHTNGLQNYRAAMLLPALTGNIEVEGGNVDLEATWCEIPSGFPSRYLEYISPLKPWSEMKPRTGSAEYPVWMELTSDAHGGALRQQILSGKPYPITHLIAFGLNFRMWPDSEYTLEALKKLEFFVCADIFDTEACKYADIVLPACTSVERSEFKSYGGGYALYTTPVIGPLHKSKSDADIVFELAGRLDIDDELMKKGYEYNIDWIFEPAGLSVEELKNQPCGVVIPPKPRQFRKYESEGFHTPSGKVECVSEVIKNLHPSSPSLPVYNPPGLSRETTPEIFKDYPLILNTGSRLPMFIHSELFRLPWTRSLRPYPAADINEDDAAALGVAQGDDIIITTPKSSIAVKANISKLAQSGVVYMYHGYPDADVNSLIEADYLDPVSGFPGFKSLLCKIEKAENKAGGKADASPLPDGDSGSVACEVSELLRIDASRCTACYTCAVACMDHNDIDPDTHDSPLFMYNESLITHSPEGVLHFAHGRKAVSCEGCRDRAKDGTTPACARACPTKALKELKKE